MRIKVGRVIHNIGYALPWLSKFDGETDERFLNRAISIDDVLRECDEARAKKRTEAHNEKL